MSKASINITDEDDGMTSVKAEFDPPIQQEDLSSVTESVRAGIDAIRFLQARAGGPDALIEFFNDLMTDMEIDAGSEVVYEPN